MYVISSQPGFIITRLGLVRPGPSQTRTFQRFIQRGVAATGGGTGPPARVPGCWRAAFQTSGRRDAGTQPTVPAAVQPLLFYSHLRSRHYRNRKLLWPWSGSHHRNRGAHLPSIRVHVQVGQFRLLRHDWTDLW